MSDLLTERLNRILPKLTSDELLSGTGLGNEIGFYIFDYPAEEELRIREHLQFLVERLPKAKPGLRVKHINLFDLVVDHLKSRNLLDRAIEMQRTQGDEAVFKALSAPLNPLPSYCDDHPSERQPASQRLHGMASTWTRSPGYQPEKTPTNH
jgi:hypothetical protein